MNYVGQRIDWMTIIDGSITKVIGEITEIDGEWMWVKGKTLPGNIEVTDRLNIHWETLIADFLNKEVDDSLDNE